MDASFTSQHRLLVGYRERACFVGCADEGGASFAIDALHLHRNGGLLGFTLFIPAYDNLSPCALCLVP